MRRSTRILATSALVVGSVLLLASCAAGPNDLADTARAEGGDPAGFLRGLWHGVIALVTFVISLFTDSVSVYEVHNNGGWYDFGFLLGLMISLGGSAGGGARSRKRG